jgi:DNA polymerase-3 subunit alpha
MGIQVLPPDINKSGVDFTPIYEKDRKEKKNKGVIRFGLAAVKGVGEKAVEQIIAAREKAGKFQSLFHFCENVDLRAANKQVLESLIKSGAFDNLGGNRAQMMLGLERAMQSGAGLQADKQAGQMNFFSQMPSAEDHSKDNQQLPHAAPWPEPKMLAFEKEVLGFYVTSNPLSHHAEAINIFSNCNSSELARFNGEKQVTIGGMVAKIRYHITKSGRNAGSKMAVFILEDLQGQVEVVLFPETLSKYSDILATDAVLFVKGKADFRRETPNIIAEELIALDDARDKLAAKVRIRLHSREINQEKVSEIKTICKYHKGKSSVVVTVQTEKGKVHAAADKSLSVNPNPEFCRKMIQLIGEKNFLLTR